MSMRTMKWAWSQQLPPTHKLVLVALSSMADDAGRCCPSVSTLARQCGISTRSARRILRDLAHKPLLVAERRLRPDGSTASNLYTLCTTEEDMVSAPQDNHDRGCGHTIQGSDDTRDIQWPGLPLCARHSTEQNGVAVTAQPFASAVPSDLTRSDQVNAATGEKPFAFLRSVIGG
ncbi:MAG: helix-turn-helix domain-containing protein [Gammaproteobacteria bacterium]|nr:helix-turn-helix domain-containing protein [Gammaproteobacteria bacterium]